MDTIMLTKARKELDQERRKKSEMLKRVELQKVQRDVMLIQAQEKKIREVQSMRKQEITEVQTLKAELEKERRDKV